MNNLRHRLKKLEPQSFNPIIISWGVTLPDGTQETRHGSFAELDAYIFGDKPILNPERGEDAKRNNEQNKTTGSCTTKPPIDRNSYARW